MHGNRLGELWTSELMCIKYYNISPYFVNEVGKIKYSLYNVIKETFSFWCPAVPFNRIYLLRIYLRFVQLSHWTIIGKVGSKWNSYCQGGLRTYDSRCLTIFNANKLNIVNPISKKKTISIKYCVLSLT